MPPDLRTQFQYVLCCAENIHANRKRIWQYFAWRRAHVPRVRRDHAALHPGLQLPGARQHQPVRQHPHVRLPLEGEPAPAAVQAVQARVLEARPDAASAAGHAGRGGEAALTWRRSRRPITVSARVRPRGAGDEGGGSAGGSRGRSTWMRRPPRERSRGWNWRRRSAGCRSPPPPHDSLSNCPEDELEMVHRGKATLAQIYSPILRILGNRFQFTLFIRRQPISVALFIPRQPISFSHS